MRAEQRHKIIRWRRRQQPGKEITYPFQFPTLSLSNSARDGLASQAGVPAGSPGRYPLSSDAPHHGPHMLVHQLQGSSGRWWWCLTAVFSVALSELDRSRRRLVMSVTTQRQYSVLIFGIPEVA